MTFRRPLATLTTVALASAALIASTASAGSARPAPPPPTVPPGISAISPSPMHALLAGGSWWCSYGPVKVSYSNTSGPTRVQLVPAANGKPTVLGAGFQADGRQGRGTVTLGSSTDPGVYSPVQDVSLQVTLLVKTAGGYVKVASGETHVGSCFLG